MELYGSFKSFTAYDMCNVQFCFLLNVYLTVEANTVTFVLGMLSGFLATDAHNPQNLGRLSKE